MSERRSSRPRARTGLPAGPIVGPGAGAAPGGRRRVAGGALVVLAGLLVALPAVALVAPPGPAAGVLSAVAAGDRPAVGTAAPALGAPGRSPASGPIRAGTSAAGEASAGTEATGATATAGPTPAPPGTLTGYRWPMTRGRLTGDYGPARGASWVVDGVRFHDGIDIASFCGDLIRAAHDGTVLAAGRRFDRQIGWVGDLGPYEARLTEGGGWWSLPITVVIDDGNGYRSVYTHFSRVVVRRGDTVRAGDLLGYEGATGNASGCHLHYGIFSPLETRTFSFRRDLAARWLLPPKAIARIDPLAVLPPRPAGISLGWGVSERPMEPPLTVAPD
ncbi:MAG: hypothetical protein RL338_1842 [Chloroflexota bacterium]|jgi:murein DD-endopeptidase MepM/ murein hydrolase activator NlpD